MAMHTKAVLHQMKKPVQNLRIDINQPIHEISSKIDEIIATQTLAGDSKIFRQNGRLVHIAGKAGKDSATICTVTHNSLPVLLSESKIIFFEEKLMKNGELKIRELSGCSQEFARRFLSDAQKGYSKIPELTGICTMPTIRPDGSIVSKQGYDSESGLFLILDQEFPAIPESPSLADAQDAVARLIEPFQTFPFKDGAAKSAYLSMLFTAVVRRSLRSAPAGLVDAPDMGTGKSLLTWAIGYIATGKSVLSMTFPYSVNEQKKTIFAALLAGASIIAFDNIETAVKGAALCTCITEEVYSDRILGVSETASAPCGAIIMLNGNNVSIEADMCTRVIPCTLDAGVENPHLRQFNLDIKKYVAENRPQMVVDILTVIRAYLCSCEKVASASRFPDWSRFIREPLVWVGEADPMDSAQDMASRDPVKNALGDILEALYGFYKDKSFLARDTIANGLDYNQKKRLILETLEAAIKTTMTDLTARSIGRYFEKNRNRIVNGMKLVNTDAKKDNNVLWRVEIVAAVEKTGEDTTSELQK